LLCSPGNALQFMPIRSAAKERHLWWRGDHDANKTAAVGPEIPLLRFAQDRDKLKAMRKTRRTSKVGESLRGALVEVFRFDLKDQRLAMVTITGAEITPDLHFARIYISGMNEEQTQKIAQDLNEQKGRIRHFLGQRIRLRVTPDLEFRYDETGASAERIEQLLSDIKKQDDES
jgi:ribosome-binding factor A